MIRKLFLLMTCTFAVFSLSAQQSSEFHPEASKDAQVTVGKARFTVLTSRLIRMEWAADAQFEDRATLGIVNRNLEVWAEKRDVQVLCRVI